MKISKPLLVCSGFAGLIHAQLTAQSAKPARIEFSPIPILSPSSLDTAPADKPAAFYDTINHQVVIQVPSATGIPNRLRYDIANGAHPSVSFGISRSSTTAIEYDYLLADDPLSVQRSQEFELLLPANDTSLAPVVTSWNFTIGKTTIPDRTSAENMASLRSISWQNTSTANSPASRVALQLSSRYLPGFTTAFVAGQTSNALTVTKILGLPSVLQPQLQSFLERGIGKTSYIVIAPIFPSEAAAATIAANFHFGLSALMRGGQVAQNSSYATALLQSLSTFLEGGAVGRPTLPAIAPGTELEQQIQQAVSLAFQQ
jgi:hypothetical protein